MSPRSESVSSPGSRTEEVIYELFNWGTGDFVFEEEDQADSPPGGVRLDVAALQAEATRRITAWQRIRQFLPDERTIPVAIGFLDDPAFGSRERTLLKLVDDNSTVAELAARGRTTEYEMSLALMAAVEKGRLKVVTSGAQGTVTIGSCSFDRHYRAR